MAGQQFQYDDSGNTFFYFLTSFVGLIVIPATYYLWPRDQNAGESRRRPALARSGGRSAPLFSAPLRAAPSCPPVLLRVPGTPPGRRGLRAAVHGAGARRRFPGLSARLRGPREFGGDPIRIVLDAPRLPPLCLPSLGFVGCSFWRERAGLGRGAREELAEGE